MIESSAVAVTVTGVSIASGFGFATTYEITGGSASFTLTVKLSDTGLLNSSASAAEQVTVVVPIGNVDPAAGLQVAFGSIPSSSATDGLVKVTTAPVELVASTVTSAGTFFRARSVSRTVTSKLAETGLSASSPSAAVHVTVVVPIGNVEPEAGLQLTAGAEPSSSVAVGAV